MFGLAISRVLSPARRARPAIVRAKARILLALATMAFSTTGGFSARRKNSGHLPHSASRLPSPRVPRVKGSELVSRALHELSGLVFSPGHACVTIVLLWQGLEAKPGDTG
jgi:hypothetical protein